MNQPPFNVLFFCARDAAGPLMAQAILNDMGDERLRAYAAGPDHDGREAPPVAPALLRLLGARGHDAAGLRPLTMRDFAAPGAPVIAFAYNVCPEHCAPVCVPHLGRPVTAHWQMPDGDPCESEEAYALLRGRIEALAGLPTDRLSRVARHLDLIGDAAPSAPAWPRSA